MALSELERAVQLRQTKAFIDADRDQLVFTRKNRQRDGAGGWRLVGAGEPRTIDCRMIPESEHSEEVSTSDGRSLKPSYTVLLMPGSDVQRYDSFMFQDEEFEIASLTENDYEVKAKAVHVG